MAIKGREDLLKELYECYKKIAIKPEDVLPYNTFKTVQSQWTDNELREMIRQSRKLLQ